MPSGFGFAPKSEPSGCDRDHMACKAKIVYYEAFAGKAYRPLI